MKDKYLQSAQDMVAQKLTELRKKKGYTSHETFAMDHNIPRVQYWRLERGKINFTLKSLGRVLAIHKLSIEEFFFLISQKR
jgi:transcriptional regulator with XRE-family HTH domain